MNKAKLIPFDIEKVKDGAKVITRCGYPAMVMIGSDKTYPVRAIVKTEEGSFTYSFTVAGKFWVSENESDLDLFIEEEEKEKPRREYSGTDSIYVPKDDEGIREELIDAINGLWDNDALPMPLSIKRKDAWITWLQKQGEEKPADNKPKFQKGDWVVFNPGGNAHQIIRVVENATSHTYGYDTVDGYYFNDTAEGVRLWNINDAKPGDVLASKNGTNILIFKQIETITSFSSYYNIQHRRDDCWANDCFIPATKEQYSQIFKKMKEDGYEWDSERNELKEIATDKAEEEPETRRMTNRELAWWLRKCPEECREYKYNGCSNIHNTYNYYEDEADNPCLDVLIRSNGGEWKEPRV